MTSYQKPPLKIEEQIRLLRSRGLVIDDEIFAKNTLTNISYYRLSCYFYNFWEDKKTHRFSPGTRLETVLKTYDFDSKLRALCFQAIETIEITIRARLSNFLTARYTAYWFNDRNISEDIERFTKNTKEIEDLIKQNKEHFIRSHLEKYNEDNKSLPSWKLLEITSFGLLSRIYGNLKNSLPEKKALARSLGLPDHIFLQSWLQSISHIRNICAHHSRLWDKKFSTTPKRLNSWPGKIELSKIYVNLCCIKYLIDQIRPDNQFAQNLSNLIVDYGDYIDLEKMGFLKDWQKLNHWKV